MSGINGTFAVPQNIKAQQLGTKLLLLEVLRRQTKREGRPVRDEEVLLVNEKVGWRARHHRVDWELRRLEWDVAEERRYD